MLVLLLLVGLWWLVPGDVNAAQLTRATMRYDRIKQNNPSTLQVTLVPQSSGTVNQIRLVFGSTTLGNNVSQTVTVTNIPSGSIALPGTLVALGSGNSIVVSGVTALTIGTTYSFNIATGVTTPSGATSIDTVMTVNAGAPVDQTTVLSRFITNDQVVITANVPPTFTFVLSGNTDVFTTDLSGGAVSTTNGVSVVVTTNAAKGWTGWVKSANVGLNSVTTGENIGTSGTVNATPETCVAGTDCYVLDVGVTSGSGGCSTTADAEYAGNNTTSGGTLSTTFQPFTNRVCKTPGDTIWLKAHATMIATKAAGNDYTDTLTIVGAGNF
jgi:hypothetical protein